MLEIPKVKADDEFGYDVDLHEDLDVPDYISVKWIPPSADDVQREYEVIDMGETRKRSLTSGRVHKSISAKSGDNNSS